LGKGEEEPLNDANEEAMKGGKEREVRGEGKGNGKKGE
jgi:hypothetical protein